MLFLRTARPISHTRGEPKVFLPLKIFSFHRPSISSFKFLAHFNSGACVIPFIDAVIICIMAYRRICAYIEYSINGS